MTQFESCEAVLKKTKGIKIYGLSLYIEVKGRMADYPENVRLSLEYMREMHGHIINEIT